jgi:AcrR family transcriptional regulator
VFSDEMIFAAAFDVLRRVGFPAMTLEAVALEVGCTRQALSRRFASKQDLMLAALDDAGAAITTGFEGVSQSIPSPLAALRARMIQPPHSHPELGDDPQSQAHTYAFVLSTSVDPTFGQRFSALQQHTWEEIRRLLDAAVARGDLRAVDTGVLGRTLLAAWIGNTLRLSNGQVSSPAEGRAEIFDEIVGPYLGR